MNTSKKFTGLFVTILLFSLCTTVISYAQGRVSYRELASRNQQPNTYFDFFTLPGSEDGKVQFVSTFRVDYNFLPFRKLNQSDTDKQFYSLLGLSMEVFKAKERRKSDDRIAVEGLETVTRTAWRDSVLAESYEQTQSNKSFISGNMTVEVDPGLYNYMLQIAPGEDTRERMSRVRQVNIKPYESQETGNILLAKGVEQNEGNHKVNLMNFGQNVYYGEDFHALVHLPEADGKASYTLNIHKLEINKRDTTRKQEIFSREIASDELITNIKPTISGDRDQVSLLLNEVANGHTYALVKIPNSTFANSVYRIEVSEKGSNRPAARTMFKSLWLDMPTSLLNLDIAIDMLRFIISKDELDRIKSGSQEEKEKKFREFWEAKDPTPTTEFNELMAEYYRRIDYAYKQFSTMNSIGYESDQGQIYIKYGPPNNIERKFPTGEPAVEIWSYDNRQFVFEATSGFGDFKLVSE